MDTEAKILLLGGVFGGVAIAALCGLYRVSRPWRIVLYALLLAGWVLANGVWYALQFIDDNNAFAVQTEEVFETLASQLPTGAFLEAWVAPPSFAAGVALTVLAILAMAGGMAVVGHKPRWWTCLGCVQALFLAGNVFALPSRLKTRREIAEQNDLRRQIYEVVKRKRAAGVSDVRIAETIVTQLRDFHGTYENRSETEESARKILKAVEELQ